MRNIHPEWISRNSEVTQTQCEEVKVGDLGRINFQVCQDEVPKEMCCVRVEVPLNDVRTQVLWRDVFPGMEQHSDGVVRFIRRRNVRNISSPRWKSCEELIFMVIERNSRENSI